MVQGGEGTKKEAGGPRYLCDSARLTPKLAYPYIHDNSSWRHWSRVNDGSVEYCIRHRSILVWQISLSVPVSKARMYSMYCTTTL